MEIAIVVVTLVVVVVVVVVLVVEPHQGLSFRNPS